jgi:hypothetical protein
LPKTPEEIPSAEKEMSMELRVERFRPVCNRLLKAVITVTELQEPPEGWIALKDLRTQSRNSSSSRIVNLERRIGFTSSVVENMSYGNFIINAAIHGFTGSKPLSVAQDSFYQTIDHVGIKSTLYIRGVLGINGNPYYKDDPKSCEPHIQGLSIALDDWNPIYTATGGVKSKDEWEADYVFFNRPPVGDETIVQLADQTAEALESLNQ